MTSTELVTILSTDWVGSTATRSRLGEDLADALQSTHDAMLKEVVERHGGRVVKNSGDGVLATFGSGTEAVAAAVDIQQRFDAYSTSPRALAPIMLRVGISVGDVVHRDDDIFGAAVIEAVRLQAAADAGQILCSDLVRALSRGRGGFEFDLVGLLELKGLAEPTPACAVRWEQHSSSIIAIALPAELVAEDALFVGRESELQVATALALSAEQAHAVWVLGEPGIGKTRLAAEVAQRAHREGALVLYGRCDEQVPAPFQPMIDALRWLVSRRGDVELRAVLGVDPDPLVRLVPELRTRFPELKPPESATETEQYRLFESVRSCFTLVAETQPVVFVVDDVHWADRPTIALLGHLVRSAEPARLTIIATARDTDPDVSDPMSELVDELDRTGRNRRLSLRGLSALDIVSLVDASELAPTDSARLAEQLADETAGNPLFVTAVLAGARPDGSLPSELPTDVRTAVRRRVGRLDQGVQDLLQFAALSGLEFSLGVASAASALSEADGLARVERAVSAALVEEMGVDRFRFTHALVREALVRELSASRAAKMHVAIAETIELRFATRLDDHLRALAQHYASAGDPVFLDRAIDYARRAARRSVDLVAFDAGIADYAFALELFSRVPDAPAAARYELLMAKGEAEFSGGMHRVALVTLCDAADVARSIGDWVGFSRAALLHEEANWRPGLLGHESTALLREAEAHQRDPKVAVMLRAARARALQFSGAPEAQDVARDALRAARELGDVDVITHALAAAVQTLAGYRLNDADVVLEHAQEAIDLLQGRETRVDIQIAQYALIAALCKGNRALYVKWFDLLQRETERAGLRFDRYVTMCDSQVRAFLDGDLVEAEMLANECLEFGEDLGEDVAGPHGVQMFFIRREQGRLGELAPLVRMLLHANPTEAMWGPGLVVLLAEIGMHDEGATLLEQLTRDDAAMIPRDMLFPAALCLLAEAAFILGRPEPAELLEAELQPWSQLGIPLGSTVSFVGPAQRYLALLAWVSKRYDAAEERFAAALDFDRRLESPVWTAHTLAEWAAFRLERGDHAGAEPLAAEAAALADRYGLVAIAAQLQRTQTR